MKTPEEIKVRLEWLAHPCSKATYGCDECIHYECIHADICENTYSCDVSKEALAYITKLEETIMLMKLQMRGDCGCCKHGRDGNMATCNKCLTEKEYHPLWEYEGLPEVESHDKPV